MASDPATRPPSTIEALSARLADDLSTIDKELGEIDLLISQATTEAGRHEVRRSTASDKLAALPESADVRDRLEQATSLVALTKRAALMETQVEVLEGKRRSIARYRDAIAEYIKTLAGVDADAAEAADAEGDRPMPPAVARLLMTTQEDLRREIAREMHDGPAQSLTNIVLQAQIVSRLMDSDPSGAAREVEQLVSMVQQTLEATKTFIFEVRPMVLDDLGLVPTLRRATRERGARAEIPVEFESMGQDRRLPMDLESSLFRMLDEALAAYLAIGPDQMTLKLDWGDRLTADLVAIRAVAEPEAPTGVGIPAEEGDQKLPPALAALVEERRVAQRKAAEAAARASMVVLPARTWREIQDRAASVGIEVELREDGSHLHVATDIPVLEGAGARS
ncbi:MAG TPA: histidine kinase [Candidatus Limnocylindrales bacterium]